MYDRALFWLFVILLLIGLVAVTSASIPYSSRLFNDPFTLQNATLFMCYFLCSLVIFHYKFLLRNGKNGTLKFFFIFCHIIIACPFIGTSVNGAKRWISLGILNFQPAEFAKLALTCF